MLDFIRIACAVPAVKVGDVEKNTADICAYMEKADAQNVDIVVFPELALTGYSCADLFFQDSLLEAVKAGLRQVTFCSGQHPRLTAVVGLPIVIGTKLYNCAAVINRGEVTGIVPKTHLPNYNEFSEKRWFASGAELENTWLTPEDLGTQTKGHGGGDTGIMKDVLRFFRGEEFDTSSITLIDRSVESHFMAFAAEESRVAGGELVHMADFKKKIGVE